MNLFYYSDVLIRPISTEKSYRIQNNYRTYCFIVDSRYNKSCIKKAFFTIYKVNPQKVNILNTKREKRRVRNRRETYYTKEYKKAYITLHEGDSIKLLDE